MKWFRVAIIGGTALALAGCTFGSTAYQVNDTKVKVAEVQQVAEGCAEIVNAPVAQLERPIANALIIGTLVREAGAQQNIEITPEQRNLTISKNPEMKQLSTNEQCLKYVHASVDTGLILQAAGVEPTLEKINQMEITVNPRYGEFDVEKAELVGTGSLSEPSVTDE